MFNPQLLKQLKQLGQLAAVVHTQHLIEQEQASLARLRRRSADYLCSYDRLFRHISIALLRQGYALTSVQPHQTLLRCCTAHLPHQALSHVIQTRHGLKHGELTQPDQAACLGLYQLLSQYHPQDAQAFVLQLQAQFGLMLVPSTSNTGASV